LLRRSARDAPGTPTDPRSPAFANSQILGLDDALPADFVGEIKEDYVLPVASLSYRPAEGLRLLAAYSKTVARPSFKEFTYITTQDPITGDFTTGNPTLTTSEVSNYDLRIEYFTEANDLVALGLFYKTIKDPMEKTILGGSNALSEIFYNNPNTATLQGVEFEFRKHLDLFGDSFLKYFSVGGNAAYIDANVEVLDSIRASHEEGFRLSDGRVFGGGFYADSDAKSLSGFETERGLVNQPEWLANFDISFDQPEWGTSATLSLFSQSDVLRTAAAVTGGGAIPNRYDRSFHELNLVIKQKIFEHFTLGLSVKNLTDSERAIVYDKDVVSGIAPEREYTVGRSYSISISGEF